MLNGGNELEICLCNASDTMEAAKLAGLKLGHTEDKLLKYITLLQTIQIGLEKGRNVEDVVPVVPF